MKKTHNIGIIGFGARARALWSQSFSTHGDIEGNDAFRLVAITDIMPDEALDKHLTRLNLTNVNRYRDPIEMFENEALDGVIIATRCSLHTKMALLAAR